jgi:hypothetical protein
MRTLVQEGKGCFDLLLCYYTKDKWQEMFSRSCIDLYISQQEQKV